MGEGKTSESKLNRIKIVICGEEYSIRTDADPKYVQRIAAKVDKELAELGQQLPNVPRERLAVLLALNLTEKLEQRAVRQARAEKKRLESPVPAPGCAQAAAAGEATVVSTQPDADSAGETCGLFGTPLE